MELKARPRGKYQRIELSPEDEKFIIDNHKRFTLRQLAEQLHLNSKAPVQRVLREAFCKEKQEEEADGIFRWQDFGNDVIFGSKNINHNKIL